MKLNLPGDPLRLTETEIRLRLDSARRETLELEAAQMPLLPGIMDGPPKHAAVLVPFLRRDNEWHILYTRRNNNLPEHSGQVSFPGGRMDPQDRSVEQTALREAWEEIGLQPEDVHLLGRLHPFHTVTNYHVTPIVGVMPWPYPIRIFEVEVERAFTIPLRWLADPANHEVRQRELPPPYDPVPVIYFRYYDGELLWGASARFTLALLEALGLKAVSPKG